MAVDLQVEPLTTETQLFTLANESSYLFIQLKRRICIFIRFNSMPVQLFWDVTQWAPHFF